MLLITNPNHEMKDPYSIDEINAVAEIHFQRDKFTDLLPRLLSWQDTSDTDSSLDEDSDDDSDSDSDTGRRRRHRRRKASKKKKAKKQAQDCKLKAAKQSMNAPKDEMDGLIQQINRMALLNMKNQMDQESNHSTHNHPHTHTVHCAACENKRSESYVGNITSAQPPLLQPPYSAPTPPAP